MKEFLSLASKRAIERGYEEHDKDWFVEIKSEELKGDLAWEENVVRRDPSAVIEANGLFHTYYTKGVGPTIGFDAAAKKEDKVFPWDLCTIFHATSKDGLTWKEEGEVVGLGEDGTFDDRSVFTPEVLEHEGKFYLVYQTVQYPYLNRQFNAVGMAYSDSPYGPFKKVDHPILEASKDGEWEGEEDDRLKVKSQGSFDSHKVHDPCVLFYKNKFYLYYKGERMGERSNFGGRQINHGVAIADNIFGPYVKSKYNPISNSGHEINVWQYKGGIGALLTTDGPERNTIQWAKDGINFEIKAHIKSAPKALGIFRPKKEPEEKPGIPSWGLSHEYDKSWNFNYLTRFTIIRRQSMKGMIGNKASKNKKD